jgi:hypothetical protein
VQSERDFLQDPAGVTAQDKHFRYENYVLVYIHIFLLIFPLTVIITV